MKTALLKSLRKQASSSFYVVEVQAHQYEIIAEGNSIRCCSDLQKAKQCCDNLRRSFILQRVLVIKNRHRKNRVVY